ncbi:probable inactive poly [ADP-ribose] polymerase SRO3 [Pistacia vera]|uniref:probable inactive poly [ADP-ribose] polymerase SRO3 n=1 Tax=Pistacia vera TaxID=55513 RepID=UPI001263AF49|nr:probable inactive poly [ADP-ribose] polymerase SRO3 [Pistacia vera]
MALPTKNLVESTRVRAPPPKPSPSPSQSQSSSSSSPPIPATKCCVRTSDSCSAHFINQNESNFKRSASPLRLMNYQNGSWIDLSNEVIDSVKSSFLERKPMVIVTIEGSKYVFDFLRMVRIDFETGKQRSIAWIDVNGKCFFPTVFLSEQDEDCVERSESNTSKIEIEINIKDGLGKRQREAVDKDDEVSSEDVSKRPRLITQRADSSGWLNTKFLKETDRAYTLVRNYFLAGMKKTDAAVTVTAIHQCTRIGHLERARLDVFQKQIEMTKAARGASNTVYSWHGTSARGVESILAHGFGVPSKISTYGIGVYLSPVGLPGLSAQLAEADQNGEKHVILCRVILGNVEKVEAGAQQCYPSRVDLDSGSDDPKNPKWYVVWPSNMNRHVIPECVVSYRSTGHLQGQLKGPSCTKYPLEKLFSKMKSSLSPTKLQEVMNLYHTYKAGKLAKDSFFKQLRLVAGDQMLLSTIREIHASE